MNTNRLTSWFRTVAASASVLLATGFASANAEEVVYVQVGGGDWATANIEALAKPFERETGIKVVPVRDFLSAAKLKLMVENDNVELDVADMPWADVNVAVENGWLEEIDYSIYDPAELEAIRPEAKREHGVAAIYAAYVMAYRTDRYSDDRPRPTTWAQFWDYEKFPGERTMRGGFYGSGPWEEALLADGVAPDEIYPMDIDRVFESLSRIRPAINKWWKEGAEGQQMLADGLVDVGQSFNARVSNLKKQGVPVEIEWNQAKVQVDFWVIPKGAKNAENAQKFIEFATRAKQQAAFAELMPYGPSNTDAYRYIRPETAAILPTSPENYEKLIIRNDDWYMERGEDGKSNLERLISRWNSWILE